MVSGPCVWLPPSSLPPHLYVSFPFLFMSFCLHALSSHSVLSFAHTTARPLACTRTTYLQPRVQGAQILTMRFGSVVVPVHLVFPLVAITHTGLVLPSSHAFILLSPLRANMHICSPLSFWAPSRGGLCAIPLWSHRGSFEFGKFRAP